jgi:RNA polymerase sigma-70 factor (ECF subfamily)
MSEQQTVDEARLIRAAQGGDAEAFGQLYEIYAPAVFRFLYAHIDDPLDAEDLTGEVFLKTWQALPGYRQRGIPFSGFLFRVARNVLYDHYRRLRRRGSPLRIDGEIAEDILHDPAQNIPSKFDHKEVRLLLMQLREDQRTVLSLRFIAGLSCNEAAQVMGKSSGAIRILQHRALEALRKIMDGREEATHDQES